MDLSEVDRLLIDDRYKGIPGGTAPFPLTEVAQRRWNVLRHDLSLPVAVLKESALAHNQQWMSRFLALSGAKLAPHGKTTMAPQLFARQLADGAWGITLATIQQVQVARRFGVPRILLANELVDPRGIEFVLQELARDAAFEFYCLVDCVAGVERLAESARRIRPPRPLGVLVEGGLAGGRTGCRTLAEALDVARAVKRTEPVLALRGVEGFEGIIAEATREESAARVREFLNFLVEITARCREERLFAEGMVLLTAGGSQYFDLVTEILPQSGIDLPLDVIVRSGCYLTHDSDLFVELHAELATRSPAAAALGEPPRAALELWSHVLSRPEPTRVVLGLGKRDASHDARLPLPIAWFRPGRHERPQPLADHKTWRLHDQHAMLDVPADSPLQVGDLVACGISHPCTTFDKWPLLYLVDDEYNVVAGIKTFF